MFHCELWLLQIRAKTNENSVVHEKPKPKNWMMPKHAKPNSMGLKALEPNQEFEPLKAVEYHSLS